MASGTSRKQRRLPEADTRPQGRVGEQLGKRCKADCLPALEFEILVIAGDDAQRGI